MKVGDQVENLEGLHGEVRSDPDEQGNMWVQFEEVPVLVCANVEGLTLQAEPADEPKIVEEQPITPAT